MATKSGITSAVNALITAVVDIPEHRASMLELINEMYPTVVTDDYVSQTYTTTGTSTIRYNITIHKSGNSCHIKGIITNPNTAVALGGGNLGIFTWKTNQYKPIHYLCVYGPFVTIGRVVKKERFCSVPECLNK